MPLRRDAVIASRRHITLMHRSSRGPPKYLGKPEFDFCIKGRCKER